MVVFSGCFWAAGARASVTIDGTRYHYLDDDQMISMRYARNLAEGHGPVWNPGGERVEGYTNFGWMVVMAAVHRAGASDATAAFWVRGISWMLGCAVILLATRLLAVLGLSSSLTLATALVPLALCYDLLFWSVNGFETTLLTALFLAGLVLALRDGVRGQLTAATCILAGLLPVVRADALDLTAAVILTAGVAGARRRWYLAALALFPVLMATAFRLSYYGDWLPNTYYLKVAGREGLFWTGLGNVKGFVAAYTVAVVLAAAVAVSTADRRLRVLACLIALGFARLLFVGPDIFPGFRFIAPYAPVLLIVAASAIPEMAHGVAPRRTIAAVLLTSTVFSAGVSGRIGLRGLLSVNGLPEINTVTGILLRRHASAGAQVAVVAAGCLPYFSRLGAIDLLGKSDRHVARLVPATSGRTGHNRFDVDWSLRTRPDFVAAFASQALVSQTTGPMPAPTAGKPLDYGTALLLNPVFVKEYRAHPVPLQILLERNALFVHAASAERSRLDAWRAPVLERP